MEFIMPGKPVKLPPRPVDQKQHLLELRVQVAALIADIDRTLSTARIRRIERRSTAAAAAARAQQRPVGVPIEYHGGGYVLSVR